MKHTTLALSLVAVLALGACTQTGTWTPMSEGRTAGKMDVTHVQHTKADKTYSHAMQK